MLLKNAPIRRRLMTIILLTSGAVLLLTCASFFAYEFFTFRHTTVENLATLGEIVANNSTASLAFANQEDAKQVLAAFKANRHIRAAALYDENGKIFSQYPENLSGDALPPVPENDGHRFENGYLISFQPVAQGTKRLGTLYLKSDMEAMHERFRLYGYIVAAVIAASLLLAYTLSRGLQRNISQPILALAKTARAIADHQDYSVRAPRTGEGELALLTDAFNQMLTQIYEGNRALSESEERFRSAMQHSVIGMALVAPDGRWLDVNEALCRIVGHTRQEMLGQDFQVVIHPDDVNTSLDHDRRMLAREMESYRLEERYLHKDGHVVWVDLSVSLVWDENGLPLHFIAQIQDITERRRNEERFRLVVEAAPNAMIMANDQGHITLVNNQTEELFGYARTELLGQPVEILIPERYHAVHPGHRTSFFQNPSTRAMGAGRDLYGRRKDGSEVPIEIGLNPIRTDQGAFVLASIIDITERKKGEQVLRENEERLQTIIENLSEGLVISDLDGQLIHWNQAGLEMHGFSSMEEGLRKLPEFQEIFELSTLDGSVLKLEEWPLARVIAGEHLVDYDVCLRRTDIDWHAVFSYGGAIVKEQNGRPLAFVTITDITKRKQVEENLRRSQAQLAGVIASAMDAIISVDEDQRIVLFNAAAETMFLYPSEEALGQPLDKFIPKRFRQAHREHIEDFGRTHVSKRAMASLGAIFGLRADGEEFPIEASISQLESEGKKLYTVILRDITERKRAEEAMKEQARILELAPVTIRDLKGRILFWNTGAEQMYGWSSEEAVGKLAHDLTQTEFPRPLEEIKARLLAHGHWEGEVVHTRKDGKRIVVASHWVLHKNDHDEPKAILEVNNDITERRQAEKEIRRLNEELEQRVADRTAQLQAVNKELEAFSYSVSHDLRAPLRHINGFSQALLEDYADKLDETGKSYLQEVRGASQEMAQLIDDVLELARVTRSEMRREVINLSEVAQAVVGELQKGEPQRTATVNLEQGLSTHGDKRLLRIVLSNLLGNAWKFTSKQDQAEITFGSEQRNGEVSYFVRDNGAGFDMAYVNKLFGAFQRLHTAREFEGTGIGLATVQRIINRHGGRVWAEGSVNQGATFYFALPNFKETGDGQQSDPNGGR